MIPEIQVKHLGLAAFICMHGESLLRYENRMFIFASTRTETEWRVEYNNSDCLKHDTLVCELRHHLKG